MLASYLSATIHIRTIGALTVEPRTVAWVASTIAFALVAPILVVLGYGRRRCGHACAVLAALVVGCVAYPPVVQHIWPVVLLSVSLGVVVRSPAPRPWNRHRPHPAAG